MTAKLRTRASVLRRLWLCSVRLKNGPFDSIRPDSIESRNKQALSRVKHNGHSLAQKTVIRLERYKAHVGQTSPQAGHCVCVSYTIDRWTDTLKIIRYSEHRGMGGHQGFSLWKRGSLDNVGYGFIDQSSAAWQILEKMLGMWACFVAEWG